MYFSGFSDVYSELKKKDSYKYNLNPNLSYNGSNYNNNSIRRNIISQDYYNNNKNSHNEYENIINSKIGLYNLGNTCYMNTCLQNLIHCKYFIKKLVKINQKQKISSNLTPITSEFFNLCRTVSNQRETAIAPNNFKKIFSSKHNEYKGYAQLDTQEFCRILLEDMNYELNNVKFPSKYKELSTEGKSKKECDKEFDALFRSRENSIIVDTFYGQIINIFTCICGYETYSFQKVLDLPLLLPERESLISLNSLLDEYFEGDNIQFSEKCKKCGKKTMHKKEIKFSQPPNVLILSFQRINERTQKKKFK